MKILQALQQIADPETRDKAVANHKAQYNKYEHAKRDVDDRAEAVLYGFDWDLTPEGEGHYYWDRIWQYLKRHPEPEETITERFMNDDIY